MARVKDYVKDAYGRLVGTIVTETTTGNKTVLDAFGREIGRYDKRTNTTRDFYGRVVGRGDACASLIDLNYYENKK